MNAFKRIFSIKGSGLFAMWVGALLVCMSISGCGLFRKKNKCGDCPKWSVSESSLSSANISGRMLIDVLSEI